MDNSYNPSLIAPNGRPTNLCEDDYHFVRSKAFIDRFGDWMNGEGKCLLDKNGEPQVFYHGTDKEFDSFDFSHLAENTGGGTWIVRDEKIPDDSEKAMFFTSSYPAAVSYAFLAHFHKLQEMESAIEKILPFIRGHKTAYSAAKSREEFLEAAKKTGMVPRLVEEIIRNPNKKILSEIIPELYPKQEVRDGLAALLELQRREVRSVAEKMRSGGLSNVYHNYSAALTWCLLLREKADRLIANDLSLPNLFGTFADHSCGFDEGWFFSDGPRLCVRVDEEKIYFDTLSEQQAVEVIDKVIRRMHENLREKYDESEWYGYGAKARIYRCFLVTAKPFEHDYEFSPFPDKYKDTAYSTGLIAARQVRRAMAEGCDSVVYRNIRDPFSQDSVGVFSPDQILIAGVERGVRIPERKSREELHPREIETVRRYSERKRKNGTFHKSL